MNTNRIPTWKLERYLLGELPGDEMEEIEKSARESPALGERIARLRQSDRDFLKRCPAETVAPQIAERVEGEMRRLTHRNEARPAARKWFLIASPAVVSALILLFVVFRETPSTRIKGDESIDPTRTQIIVYRKTDRGVETLKSGDRVRAGDLLQLAYVSAGKKFGVIVSIDGNGAVTLHYPKDKTASARLEQERKVMLETSYQLDAAPNYECFYLISAAEEIPVQDILDRVETAGRKPDFPRRTELELPASLSQFAVLLNKGDDR